MKGQKFLLKDNKTIITITNETEKSVSISFELPCDCGILNCFKSKKGVLGKEQLKLYSPMQEEQ